MQSLPFCIYLVFGITVILALFIFYRASNNAKNFLAVAFLWVLLQSIISLTGFYTNSTATPPRFPLLIAPPVIAIIILFATKKGRAFIDSLSIKSLTILHIIRIPVELVLYWLFIYKAVPELITFEGSNFDVLSGISAPFIYYFGFVKGKLPGYVILAWNFICLGLLVNVVYHALLSAPTPFQQFAFDQPNIAITYFPFVLLPALLVPLVLFSHLAAIKQLAVRNPA